MNQRKLVYLNIGIILSFIFCVFYIKYNSKTIDITQIKSNINISASDLTNSFIYNEELAHKTYKNQAITVTGILKKITTVNHRKTLILYGYDKDTHVICDIENDELNKNMINTEIKIKGICKGFLKDVILLNCALINTPNHE